MSNQVERGPAGGDILPPLERMVAVMSDATEAYFGEPGHDPAELPNPRAYERRADIPSADLPTAREAAFRVAMDELGPGRETDVDAEAAGLSDGYIAVGEAGQAQKLVSALQVIRRDLQRVDGVRPRAIILPASPDRVIGDDERQQMIQILHLDISVDRIPANEYDLARLILERMAGFRSYDPEVGLLGEFDMGYNYTLQGDPIPGGEGAPVNEQGRFMCIGVLGKEIPVILLRLDREDYEENGERRYRQLDDKGKMRLIAQLLKAGGASVQQVGFVTGAAYQLTRIMSAAQVEKETGVAVRVMSYGRATLTQVKGEPATLLSIGQLAGELHLAWQRIQTFANEPPSFVITKRPEGF